ncbi:hypothetical protein B0H10DRAFT_1946937 [Mycena sp. CBHHK59/15]|nr:hypothetical protein B0H10DRAFT_1946937 [Mycena sp. CBHHK59/15]
MQLSTRLESLIQYTALAASTAKEISDTARIRFLASMATLSLTILESIQLYSTSETQGVLPATLLYNIAKFTKYMEQNTAKGVHVHKVQQGMGKIKQIFKQFENASRLEACKAELQDSLDVFRLQTAVSTIPSMMQM